jgi:hypothetical protein
VLEGKEIHLIAKRLAITIKSTKSKSQTTIERIPRAGNW